MYTVLLAVDSDEARAEKVLDVMRQLPIEPGEVEIVVLNVFKEFDVTDGDGGAVKSEDLFDEADLPESVRNVTSTLEADGYAPTIRREHGNVVETIVETAVEIDANLIVMAGRSRSPVGKALFGSTIQGVLAGAHCPVTVSLE